MSDPILDDNSVYRVCCCLQAAGVSWPRACHYALELRESWGADDLDALTPAELLADYQQWEGELA